MLEEVTIEKLVHGGQGLGELADGRKVFVWNALPGEVVRVRIIKKKRSYAEAIAEEIVKASPERIEPQEENYLATSPWQMMTYEAENKYKGEIVRELFAHEKIGLPESRHPELVSGSTNEANKIPKQVRNDESSKVVHDDREWNYRNKMEYSFWGDEEGLHLALHRRGSSGKQIVAGSKLALPAIDAAANAVCVQLSKLQARAGDLKTIIVRCSQKGEAVAAIFTKLEQFSELTLPPELKGLRVYHSNPRSPASVPTKLLYELGDCTLTDELLGKPFHYDVDSFFQVNVPIFERALEQIRAQCTGDPVDMYSGVGSIGLSVAKSKVALIELDPATAAMARVNATSSGLDVEVVEAPTEKVLDYIVPDRPIIFDPPRAGLHPKVIDKTLEILPKQIIYLSCNPATQARDLSLLQEKYEISHFEVYNFFPRTPHIETLAVLRVKG